MMPAIRVLHGGDWRVYPACNPNGHPMTNINGKAYAMNAITPMKWWKTPILKLLFFLAGFAGLSDLKNLSFIHFARWVIIKRGQFPWLGGNQPRENLEYDYMIFFSNFNGTWNQYIDAFSAVLALGLNAIWIWSQKFPGSVPVTAFKRYIALVQFDTDYYYNPYPYATTNDVKAAHRIQAALDDFAKASEGMTPQDFEKAYLQFVMRVQNDLGALGPAPVGV
jgi:hypothetical protein